MLVAPSDRLSQLRRRLFSHQEVSAGTDSDLCPTPMERPSDNHARSNKVLVDEPFLTLACLRWRDDTLAIEGCRSRGVITNVTMNAEEEHMHRSETGCGDRMQPALVAGSGDKAARDLDRQLFCVRRRLGGKDVKGRG